MKETLSRENIEALASYRYERAKETFLIWPNKVIITQP